MSTRHRFLGIAIAVAAALALASRGEAAFQCTIAAKQGDPAPGGGNFGSRFADPVDCNDAGDCLFVAQPKGMRDGLYKFPNAGAPEKIAMGDGASVAGSPSFRSSNVFRYWSLNDTNDVAFLGMFRHGAGVFVRRDANPLQVCAQVGDLAPGGGTYSSFKDVSPINANGHIAFIADVQGTEKAFECECNGVTCTVTQRLAEGDPTAPSGRTICELKRIGKGDSGRLGVLASISANCNASQTDAILDRPDNADPTQEVAVVGEACPIPPGGNFTAFDNHVAPQVNANAMEKIGFQGTCSPHRTGIFLYDPSIPSTVAKVLRGDAAPVPPGGFLGHVRQFSLSDDDEVTFRTTLGSNTAKFCIFRFDSPDEPVVCKSDAPPSPPFSMGSRYVNIRDAGGSSNGEWACARVRVQDPTAKPRLQTAILRCEHQ